MDWNYSKTVKKHFMSPKNFICNEPKEGEFDAEGEAGSVSCGDIMKVWIDVDKKTDKVKKFKWKTWGCATAIASTSAFSEMVTANGGMKVDDALKITPHEIAQHLGGLPPRKFHCSVLADKAFKNAVEKYRLKK